MDVSDKNGTESMGSFAPYQLRQPAFEGAATDYRNAHRMAILGDQDRLAMGEYLFLQARCKHAIRNNPTAQSARNKHVVDLGVINVRWEDANGSIHPVMTDLWKKFTDNCSYDGKGNFAAMQVLWNHQRFTTGEAITRMVIAKTPSDEIPLRLHPIGSEYLDMMYVGQGQPTITPIGRTRYGITFDEATLTKPEFYNFFKDRYYGLLPPVNAFQRIPVPAEDVLHIFERTEAGQWRGIPLLASCLIQLYEIEDLCTATVRAQTSASAITWIVSELTSQIPDAAGTVNVRGRKSIQDASTQLAFDHDGGSVQYTNGKFTLVQSRDIGSNLVALLREEYQKIGSALDIPYYKLSGNTQDLDFSTLRGILIDVRRKIEFLYITLLIPEGIGKVVKRGQELAVAMNFPVEDAVAVYEFPRAYGVDDLKDAQADLLEVISGLEPIQAKWTERGYTKEQIAKSIALIKELGLEAILNQAPKPAQNNGAPDNHTSGS